MSPQCRYYIIYKHDKNFITSAGTRAPRTSHQVVNSLVSGICGNNSKVFSLNSLWVKWMSMSYEISLGWLWENTFHDKSTLVQVMAWCHQATSHCLSQMMTQIYASIWHQQMMTKYQDVNMVSDHNESPHHHLKSLQHYAAQYCLFYIH